jgi:hypothetical protein
MNGLVPLTPWSQIIYTQGGVRLFGDYYFTTYSDDALKT